MSIEFRVNYDKILEAIVYILDKRHCEAKSIFILKCLYYTDKFHLQRYACPITGDAFVKLKHGPCATTAYNLLLGSELYIPEEFLAKAKKAFKVFTIKGICDYNLIYKSIRNPEISIFSQSNIECIDKAIAFCSSFDDDYSLSEESHKEIAWQNAELRGKMSYELMIDENTEHRDEIIEYLHEYSGFLCL